MEKLLHIKELMELGFRRRQLVILFRCKTYRGGEV